jgi:hypothetical protein
MPGATVGLSMGLGYPGSYSRNGDCIIEARPVLSTDATGPNFGDAVVLVQDSTGGTFSAAAIAKGNGHATVMTQGANYCFAGVAVREVKTLKSFVVQPNASATLAGYAPSEICDVLVRGTVVVEIQNPSAAAIVAGGSVFLRMVAGTGTVIGAFEPAADGGNTVQLTNCYFTTGVTSVDANGNTIAEITIINRNIP